MRAVSQFKYLLTINHMVFRIIAFYQVVGTLTTWEWANMFALSICVIIKALCNSCVLMGDMVIFGTPVGIDLVGRAIWQDFGTKLVIRRTLMFVLFCSGKFVSAAIHSAAS